MNKTKPDGTRMNAIVFCKLVEQRLGWEAPHTPLIWDRYIPAANHVNRKIATNPALYTWDALELAVELLHREGLTRSPVGVLAHVERALKLAVEPEDDIETQIRSAMATEINRGDPLDWTVRFMRATGRYRELALREWQETRGDG